MMKESENLNTDGENNIISNKNEFGDKKESSAITQQKSLLNYNKADESILSKNTSNIDHNANPSSSNGNISSSIDDPLKKKSQESTPTLIVSSNQTEQVQNKPNTSQNNTSASIQMSETQSVNTMPSRKSSIQSQTQSAILKIFQNPNVQNIHRESLSNIYCQNETFQIPIIGYEIMEERARFTIFKLRIDDPRTGLSWMVFRRYTDFVRLYSKLKAHHPNLNIPLPGKRWFKDNFDPAFLDDRVRGLQIFVNVVIRKLYSDSTVRDFFCLDEPPPVCDAEPESLALFGALEDTVGALKNQIRQKEETIEYLRKKVFYLEEKMKECVNCNSVESSSVKSNIRNDKSVASSSSSSC